MVNYDNQARTAIVRGAPDHPANLGRLCSKGAALGETLSLDGRCLHPLMHGNQVDWSQALDEVAAKFSRVIQEHGPDAVAFYVSGQLLTEDYYVANKLMKGFIGSANIDTNSRLCMSSAVAGQKRAFGSDSVPCNYEDLERTNLVVIAGSNTAWCHPVIYQRIKKAKTDNPALQIVVIDPRRTATCEIADMHLAIRSGTDALLFNGLLAYLHQHGEVNRPFIDYCTEGLAPALAVAQASATLAQVATGCDLTEQQVAAFYELFARKEKVVTLYSQGVNQSSSGTDKVNSIINCHLLSGRMGRPGMGPFSLTGQPNAMGGREVGGLSNQLAAHMELGNAQHRHLVQSFWKSPVIADKPGYKAVELFDAVLDGKVKAIWIMATNPAVSLPDNNRVRQALARCEFVVVSDCVTQTDTTAFAHVLLPAATWGERDGTVTNSERRISRQRAFRDAPGEARPDWWIVCEVAQRMAKQLNWPAGFGYTTPREIFDEYAALTGYNNHGTRDLDISALVGMDEAAYQNLAPVQWPVNAAHTAGTPRMFEDGIFFTTSGKAQFVPVTPRLPVNAPDALFPLILNTGRLRDQWHTMTRTGRSARLSAHEPEPFLQLHKRDAAEYAVSDGELVTVSSQWGVAVVRARLSDDIKPGTVFMPIHWSNQFASSARADALVNPVCDPYSGQPEFKHTPVNIGASRKAWYGFMLSRRRFQMSLKGYWSMSLGNGLWRYELAGDELPRDWAAHARELLCARENDVAWMEYFDRSTRRYRAGRMVGNRLESCIFIGPNPQLPNRDWLMKLFAREQLSEQDKAFLLSGQPGDRGDDVGAAVCACFGVGRNTLLKLIESGEVATVADIGKRVQAGTNCGSCIPELQALLAAQKTRV
jgi:assimilatory nitrate reductase catalytic subunit